MNGRAKHSHLETLVINLSLDDPELPMSDTQLSHCCSEYGYPRRGLYPEMLEAAKVAVARLPSIQTFRIIHQRIPSVKVAEYDVCTEKEF
jgi:hypothetical protein